MKYGIHKAKIVKFHFYNFLRMNLNVTVYDIDSQKAIQTSNILVDQKISV